MSRTQEAIVATALTWAVLLSGLSLLAACGKKVEKSESAAPAAAEPAAPVAATQEQKVDAMLRGHPNSKRICVDGERTNAFFLDYGPIPTDPAQRGLFNGGIWFIEKVEFYRTSNNTWFITNQEDNKYVQVYPDMSGLTCKIQGS